MLVQSMTTSKRIAIQFMFLVGGLILIFAIFLNTTFFLSWYNPGLRKQFTQKMDKKGGPIFLLQTGIGNDKIDDLQNKPAIPDGGRFLRSIELTTGDMLLIDANRNWLAPRIAKLNDDWILIEKTPLGYRGIDITPNIERQQELVLWSLLLVVLFSLGTYWVAQWFVKRNLRDLYLLADRVKDSDITHLQDTVVMDYLPPHDEINIVAAAIDRMKTTIHSQIEAITHFVGHVSHEFKTPLMMMQSDIDVARQTGKYDKMIDRSAQSVKHLSAMLDTLLLMTHVDSGKPFSRENVSVGEVVERVVATMKEKYNHKHISWNIICNAPVILETNPTLLETVLTNIIENANKYNTEKGHIDILIDAKAIVVRDTGVGMSEETMNHMREPFWQHDKNRTDGVGMGLSLVKKLLGSLGFHIDIASELGQGTTVTIYFS